MTLAGGSRVSGSVLASQLGISRAAISKRLIRLRDQGLDLAAAAGSGYQLRHPLQLLDANTIRSELSVAAGQGIDDISVHWEIDSTNSLLMRRPPAQSMRVSAALAEIQTGGRGRRGKQWRSAIGGSLALSLAWRFETGMSALAGLGSVAGIALIDALTRCGYDAIGLKWPNDAVVDDRKLAGILVEIGGEAHGPSHAVIGIGINLRMDPATAETIDQPWIDLASLPCRHAPPSRNSLAAAVLSALVDSLQRFERDGFRVFADDYARYDALLGREIRVIGAHADRLGIAVGIDGRGALKVRDQSGEFLVDSGEVSVRAA